MPQTGTDAVIGHTGFVGSTLMRSLDRPAGFNSASIAQAYDTRYRTLYCAAAPGSMFEANRFPDRDAERIDRLIASLGRITADRIVLISTIAVLDRFDGGRTEEDASFQTETPYGVNRRRLELACEALFSQCLIVRLPALFGTGLAKNFIFDLMNPLPSMLNDTGHETLSRGLSDDLRPALAAIYRPDRDLGMRVIDRTALAALPERDRLEAEADALGINAVMFHNPETTYQYYEMARLAADIDLAVAAGIDVLHLAPEPLRAGDVHLALTGREMPGSGARLHREDMRTVHADLWDRTGPYNRSAGDVMVALAQFYRAETAG